MPLVNTRSELLRNVWGYETLGATRTLDSHVCRLRGKLASADQPLIVNIWGVGYPLLESIGGTGSPGFAGR